MKIKPIVATILDERVELSLEDMCRACDRHAEWIIELVEVGILDPVGSEKEQWQFPGPSLKKAHAAMRLERDLELNLPGIALALDLIEEIEELRVRLYRLESSR